jgi:Na+-transporting methylmalonyl-CoA/oxaloacetate decarboxylase gamma subunit
MNDFMILVAGILFVYMVLAAFVILFSFMSNSRIRSRPETLKEANARLIEMRKEYNSDKEDDS